MENKEKLFCPYKLNNLLELKNRMVMAPLTRRRAENPDLAANELIARYYEQRSSAGLIIAEGSQISHEAYGYTHSPGCFSPAQIRGWKKSTHAVHQAGGTIFLQLWHVGPFSHKHLQPGNLSPLSASPVIPEGTVLNHSGERKPYESSRAMTKKEIFQTVKDFGKAAQNAIDAGFDGVEIHGAHAYVIDQFIMDGTNQREDEFGGTIENRSRFLFMIIEEILKFLPAQRVGLRLSPRAVKESMYDSKPLQTYGYVLDKLNQYDLAYLHISEMMSPEERLFGRVQSIIPHYRKIFNGKLISCGGHTHKSATDMIERGEADLIAFGKFFISNPDLVFRFQHGLPLQPFDKDTFYHGQEKGYIDYPFHPDNPDAKLYQDFQGFNE